MFALERTDSSTGPVQPGELIRLKSLQTGAYGRVGPVGSATTMGGAARTGPRGGATPGLVKIIGRGLLQAAGGCTAEGLLFDQASAATASNLTYTGTGLSYNGVPLVQAPGSNALVASSDPACSVPDGGLLSFSPAALSAMPPPVKPPLVGACQAGRCERLSGGPPS